jgi:hypothetical protein
MQKGEGQHWIVHHIHVHLLTYCTQHRRAMSLRSLCVMGQKACLRILPERSAGGMAQARIPIAPNWLRAVSKESLEWTLVLMQGQLAFP